jgi:hypothetical protein
VGKSFWAAVRRALADFADWSRRRWTIMVIPHNEKQSRNFHLSNTILFGMLGVLAVTLGIASVSLVGA